MKTSGVSGKLFVIFEWITRLAYINVLWIGFSFLGILVFGLFPATFAMFAATRDWIKEDSDTPVFSAFWKRYKGDFWKANGIGWLMTGLGIVLYLDYLYFSSSATTLLFLLKSFTMMLVFVYVLIFTMLFPVFVHYKVSIKNLFKNALFIPMLHPVKSIVMILGAATIGYTILIFPSLIPFFGGSLTTLYITWIAQTMFLKIDEKVKQTNE
jgi:uncharacterized membrane protein YesL